MKRAIGWTNQPPRTWLTLARILAILVLVTLPLVSNIFTDAKYVASAAVEAGARVAKFSFVVGNQKYKSDPGKAWHEKLNLADIDNASPAAVAAAKYWRQIAIDAGEATLFELPMWDYEYYGADDYSNEATVKTSGADAVIAPGTNSGYSSSSKNGSMHNPNYDPAPKGTYTLQFRNDSEVSVRYKVEVDEETSLTYGGYTARIEIHTPFSTTPKHTGTYGYPNYPRMDDYGAVLTKNPESIQPASALSDGLQAGSDLWVYMEPGGTSSLPIEWHATFLGNSSGCFNVSQGFNTALYTDPVTSGQVYYLGDKHDSWLGANAASGNGTYDTDPTDFGTAWGGPKLVLKLTIEQVN